MVGASFLLAAMSLAVKLASRHYSAGEIAFYRGLLSAAMLAVMARGLRVSLRTPLPIGQFWRSLTGAVAMTCFFYALGHLPLGLAVTLNFTSSIWIAAFALIGLALVPARREPGSGFLMGVVALGFLGVVLVLRPTVHADLWGAGLIGAAGGMLSGWAHLQAGELGRAGEPAMRTVFYFAVGNVVAGGVWMLVEGSTWTHSLESVALLVAIALSVTAAQWMLTRAYQIGRPLVNASLQYLSIAWAFAFGLVLFGESVDVASILGIGIIIAAGIAARMVQARS